MQPQSAGLKGALVRRTKRFTRVNLFQRKGAGPKNGYTYNHLPVAVKEPGSPEWCYQSLYILKTYYNSLERFWQEFSTVKQELEQQRAWEKIPPGKPYGSLEAMLEAELGAALPEIERKVVLAKNGGDRRSEEYQPSNIRLKSYGTTHDYTLARLERDAPELAERVAHGSICTQMRAPRASILLCSSRNYDRPLSMRYGRASRMTGAIWAYRSLSSSPNPIRWV